ncbi:MAG: hypothetical protein WBM84_08175, partial [Sedimenticolaceae bacterium]
MATLTQWQALSRSFSIRPAGCQLEMTTRELFGLGNLTGRGITTWLPLVMLVGLTGCQPTFVLNQLTPRDVFVVQRDLAYGPDPRHRLDLYLPSTRTRNKAVVVFIHGGSWDSGDK